MTSSRQRLPEWFKIRPPSGENVQKIRGMVKDLQLSTVCQEARCPNLYECWDGGTATFMVMGDTCTRGCRFCHVKTGNPAGLLDQEEPRKVAESVRDLNLDYIVITSVDRDDLPDGGADHFGKVIEAVRRISPKTLIEVLIPDFQGDEAALQRVVDAGPHVIAHNLETVRRLTPTVRDRRARYDQSLAVLAQVKAVAPHIYTKTSIMLGLGERDEEVHQAMDDLRAHGVDVLTFGQYLKPANEPRFLDVVEYVTPERFDAWARVGLEEKGFLYVASGPLVRSSYRAGEFFMEGLLRAGVEPPSAGGSGHGDYARAVQLADQIQVKSSAHGGAAATGTDGTSDAGAATSAAGSAAVGDDEPLAGTTASAPRPTPGDGAGPAPATTVRSPPPSPSSVSPPSPPPSNLDPGALPGGNPTCRKN